MSATGPPVVAVLAGGRGERLGGRKATVSLDGRPLITYPLQSARDAGLEAVVVAKQKTQLPSLSERVIYDTEQLIHPLSGVLAALAEFNRVIALACDMPFVPASMLRWLAEQDASTIVTRPGNFIQPFPALYGARSTRSLYTSLMSERSLQDTIERLQPKIIEQSELMAFGAEVQMFFSVNTEADLVLAESWLRPKQQPA